MTGLPSRFQLKNGKFLLTSGASKTRDGIWFYCTFDKIRVYTIDFGADLHSLIQKPVAYLFMNKTLIIGKLKKGVEKFVPDTTVDDIDIGYTSMDRKKFTLQITYSSKDERNEIINDITFV